MNRDERRVIRKAASLLLADARAMREPCQGSPKELWSCGECPARDKHGICDTQRVHDAHVKTATKLKAMAGRAS